MADLPRRVTISTSDSPAATASSTTSWIVGVSMTGTIALGMAFATGRNLVPRPAAGMTALVTAAVSAMLRTLAIRREDLCTAWPLGYPALIPARAALTARGPFLMVVQEVLQRRPRLAERPCLAERPAPAPQPACRRRRPRSVGGWWPPGAC